MKSYPAPIEQIINEGCAMVDHAKDPDFDLITEMVDYFIDRTRVAPSSELRFSAGEFIARAREGLREQLRMWEAARADVESCAKLVSAQFHSDSPPRTSVSDADAERILTSIPPLVAPAPQKVVIRDAKSIELKCDCSLADGGYCGRSPAGEFMLENWPDSLVLCERCEQHPHTHERGRLSRSAAELDCELKLPACLRKPATYVYAGSLACQDCAGVLVESGDAHPAEVQFLTPCQGFVKRRHMSQESNEAEAINKLADSIEETVKPIVGERPDVVLFALLEVSMRIMKKGGKSEEEGLDTVIEILTDMRKNKAVAPSESAG